MQNIKTFASTVFLSVFMLLATIAGSAHAQSEGSASVEVEVPQALGPDAMKALLGRLQIPMLKVAVMDRLPQGWNTAAHQTV